MPLVILRALYERIPRLRARELLDGMGAIALGTGHLEKREADKLLRSLRRAAAFDDDAPAGMVGQLAALGIPMVKVPRG